MRGCLVDDVITVSYEFLRVNTSVTQGILRTWEWSIFDMPCQVDSIDGRHTIPISTPSLHNIIGVTIGTLLARRFQERILSTCISHETEHDFQATVHLSSSFFFPEQGSESGSNRIEKFVHDRWGRSSYVGFDPKSRVTCSRINYSGGHVSAGKHY
ncbi:uncharacterized protein BT62DRAFT_1003631 [Guyanagaster necrorhizus]|uniref:Uncharacterized protein n=1 Tax=Guyanagaster necrorhizus TaxID=856835 RepID=A0A9P8AUV8_9AGAR|nr:uncharacterized protein BT62DRAFT_1003631 [Guyanagaster necrorhizus MCA 3950]KAG7448909.1 hypothetical protein BT62DRAFT_1003631 [Guyanagaster necrorhizus MCA 3950]